MWRKKKLKIGMKTKNGEDGGGGRSTLNTGRFYFSDMSNSHTQWEDPRKAGGAGDGMGGGLVATLALAPIAFLAVAMFVRVMYLQVYYPEYLYPKRYRRMKKKGFPRNKVRRASCVLGGWVGGWCFVARSPRVSLSGCGVCWFPRSDTPSFPHTHTHTHTGKYLKEGERESGAHFFTIFFITFFTFSKSPQKSKCVFSLFSKYGDGVSIPHSLSL